MPHLELTRIIESASLGWERCAQLPRPSPDSGIEPLAAGRDPPEQLGRAVGPLADAENENAWVLNDEFAETVKSGEVRRPLDPGKSGPAGDRRHKRSTGWKPFQGPSSLSQGHEGHGPRIARRAHLATACGPRSPLETAPDQAGRCADVVPAAARAEPGKPQPSEGQAAPASRARSPGRELRHRTCRHGAGMPAGVCHQGLPWGPRPRRRNTPPGPPAPARISRQGGRAGRGLAKKDRADRLQPARGH